MEKEEILELLDEIVVRLEGPALDLYETFVSYYIALGGILTGVSILLFVGIGFALRTAIRINKRDEGKRRYERSDAPFGITISASLVGIGAIFVLVQGLLYLLAPGIHALRAIVPGL